MVTATALVKTRRRGRVRALDGVTLQLAAGESAGLIGPNGAGKSTLLHCLLGFLTPDSGSVAIDGRSPDDLAARAVTGFVPERLVYDAWMSGREFLAHHHALCRLERRTRRRDVDELLARVGLPEEARDRRIGTYSRGMRQRLGLAGALVARPALLLLDEPTSGIDPDGILTFRAIMAEERARGATLLTSSHQLQDVEKTCDRIVLLRDGRIEAIRTVDAGADAPRILRVILARVADPPDLEAAALEANGELAGTSGRLARFRLADDAAAGRLLGALHARGLVVVEAAPEEGRLERLFRDGGGSAP